MGISGTFSLLSSFSGKTLGGSALRFNVSAFHGCSTGMTQILPPLGGYISRRVRLTIGVFGGV